MPRTKPSFLPICLAIVCAVYFCVVAFSVGFSHLFAYAWLLLAVCFAAWTILRTALSDWIVKVVRVTFIFLAACGILAAGYLFVAGTVSEPALAADYLIVLGAKVEKDGPSVMLEQRILSAAAYAKQYPEAQVIASGGQGSDELVSEASAIAERLVALGVSRARIQLEEASHNTRENLTYGKTLLQQDKKVVLVTSEFHVARAKMLAQKLGYQHVSAEPASSKPWYLLPHFYAREVLAFAKDAIR